MTVQPVTFASTEEAVREVLGLTYDRFGFQNHGDMIERIVAIVDDASKKEVARGGRDTSMAAEEIREALWNRYSGGGASAGATVELFLMLDRADELGWVTDEAHYRPYMAEELPSRVLKVREAKQNA